jgi:NHLM bacteriocin system ABC transporter ATP-binding protein
MAADDATAVATAFPVDDPDGLWQVATGRVDVFSVPRGAGADGGPRRFLYSAGPGDHVLGMVSVDAVPYPVTLVAVPVGGTTLRREEPAALWRAATTPAGRLDLAARLEAAIGVLGRAVGAAVAPRLHHVALAPATVSASTGERVAVGDRPLWATVISGRCTIGDTALAGELVPGAPPFPLARGVWLRAAEDTQLSLADTDTALASGAARGGMERLRDFFVRWASDTAQRDEDAELDRYARRTATESRVRERGLTRLAGLLGDAAPAAAHGVDTDDPLLAALQCVGAAAGLTFRAAPAWERESRRNDALQAICRASRVRARQVGLRGEWWTGDAGPLLAFTKETRDPVALLWRGSRGYHWNAPGGAERPLTPADAGGIEPLAFTFYRPFPPVPVTGRRLLALAVDAVRAEAAQLLAIAFAAACIGLIVPWATNRMLSDIVPVASYGGVAVLTAALIAVQLGAGLFDATKAFVLVRIDGRTNAALQAGIVDRLLALPVPFYRGYSVGDLAGRAGAINAVRDLLSGAAVTSLLSGVFALVYLVQLWWYSWRLALVAAGVMVVALGVTALVVRRSLAFQREAQTLGGRLSGLTVQLIGAIPKLRVAAAEGRAFAQWSERFHAQKAVAAKADGTDLVLQVFNTVLPLLASLALFGVAGWMVKEAKPYALTPAEFIAFNASFGTFFGAVVSLGNTLILVLAVVPLLERAAPILEALPEVDGARSDPGELTGRIAASHVSFRYRADGPLILEDVSFHADPGEFIAFVGPSGSGKSTTLRMLLGFEQPETGAVYYDGQDLATLDITAVRAQIGVVLQASKLSQGDVFQNIVGSAPLTLEDAWAAADAAGLAADIEQMPMQMHTVVSEGGSTLSGGQRQRLLIARALARAPRIILFDEATSALDNRTQELVGRSLERTNATRIVIAHRLSTVRNADRIYVVDKGRIVQEGTYDTLAAQPGLFADLVRRQLAG